MCSESGQWQHAKGEGPGGQANGGMVVDTKGEERSTVTLEWEVLLGGGGFVNRR